jgi:phenylalanyl-tRNA synthetase beta chain
MPVVEVPLITLMNGFPRTPLEEVVSALPFLGLDIEGRDGKCIRLEYNPNRPDFSSYCGIIRALKGYLGIETALPRYRLFRNPNFEIVVDRSIKAVRPYIRALVARNAVLDRGTVKMLIDMQEDLHNGICNKRKLASIGLHNPARVKFPLNYGLTNSDTTFVPLDHEESLTLDEILTSTDVGRKYSSLLHKSNKKLPILGDAEGRVLSFPPIINSSFTKLDHLSNGVFVEVTAIDRSIADLVAAIYASTLCDMNFMVYHVLLKEPDGSISKSPDMIPSIASTRFREIDRFLGFEFPKRQIVMAAKRSRLGIRNSSREILSCTIPRYRTDIRHSRDLVEEVMIGLGISKLSPVLPLVNATGSRNNTSVLFEKIRQVLVGLGLLEIKSSNLVSTYVQFESMGVEPNAHSIVKIANPFVSGHDTLRDSLLPSLVETLSHNVHTSYPQNIFEVGKVFAKRKKESEKWHLCVAIAHNKADYTGIKAMLQAFMKTTFGKDVETTTPESHNEMYVSGRSADIMVDGMMVGVLGQVSTLVVLNHRIRVPVSAYEMDLSHFLKSFRSRNKK